MINRIPTKRRKFPDIPVSVWLFILIATAMGLGYIAGV